MHCSSIHSDDRKHCHHMLLIRIFLIKNSNFIASYSKDLLFYSCLLMMRKIDYNLIGGKIKMDTNYYYMTPKVNSYNDNYHRVKAKIGI